jgi:hypothetical protein
LFVSSGSKRCGRCKQVKPETDFNRSGEGRQHWCRECFREYFRTRGDVHRRQSLDAKTKRVERDRAFTREYLQTHPCIDCGEGDGRVLDFDHLADKTHDICEMVLRGWPLARLRDEIAQCEVVCANCHRRRTAIRAGWRRLDLDSATFRNWKEQRNVEFVYGYLASNPCADCGLADPLVLEFDHVGEKRGAVMTLAWDGYSLASIIREIAHCEVRCCNYHRRRTVERRTTAA